MSDELIPVTHYGLHTTPDGVAYLHQGRKASNFISMRQLSPYEVTTKRKRLCPHLINPASTVPDRAHWELFLRLFDDPLVQALMPIPKDRNSLVPYINDPNGELMMDLVMLSRMGSPVFPVVMPINKLPKATILEELSLTNVLPLVLTGVETADQRLVNELAVESRTLPRKLVFAGNEFVVIRNPLIRIATELWHFDRVELQSLNMETIGAAIIRRYARGERIDTEFVRDK
jgi:hypothetical protein